MKTELYTLERAVVICAERSTVFRFFTDSKLFADWWGAGSETEGVAGGAIRIRNPNGVLASGTILELDPGRKIIFTFGFDSGIPMLPEASRVTVLLEDHPDGTLLSLRHEFEDEKARDHHIQGWRYQLAVFANAAARQQHANLKDKFDLYFAMWNETDAPKRREIMNQLLLPDVSFHDVYSCTSGIDDLDVHLAAAHQFMPGIKLSAEGDPQLCQGMAMTHWIARNKDGGEIARGINFFELAADSRFRKVIGFWMPVRA